MSQRLYPIPQSHPPRSPRETLPTMYDLPSENPESPGLPDEYHDLQPELLSRTFRCPFYPPERVFMGTDINLYYDVRHIRWYKRPDWFLVVGVSRLYEETDLRASYVVWQEGVAPFVVVELLSPGTSKEDMGENATLEPEEDGTPRDSENPQASGWLEEIEELEADTEAQGGNGQPKERPPRKWDAYERILRVPYYVVFSRYTNRVRFFQLVGGRYQERAVNSACPQVWIPDLEVGLGLWQGEFRGFERQWLRWYDAQGDWLLTDTEEERQRAEQAEALLIKERQRAEQEWQQLSERLRARGINPDELWG